LILSFMTFKFRSVFVRRSSRFQENGEFSRQLTRRISATGELLTLSFTQRHRRMANVLSECFWLFFRRKELCLVSKHILCFSAMAYLTPSSKTSLKHQNKFST
jgi:hypothetical protein